MEEKYRHTQFSTKGLVAYYKLFAGYTAGLTVHDYSGSGFTGTSTSSIVADKYPGMSFNGTHTIVIGTGPTDVKTISIWANPLSIAAIDEVIRLQVGIYISIATGVVTVTGIAGSSLYVNGILGTSGVTTVEANKWSHIAVTDASANNASVCAIGKNNTDPFEGTISDVALFDVEKTAAEIKSIYELTKWRYPNN
jgi:hypothetical protein